MKKHMRKNKSRRGNKSKNITVVKQNRGSIKNKLIGSYSLLIIFIIVVGALSYKTASNAIIGNYETSTNQALDMLGEYVEYGFAAVKTTAVEYLVDEELTNYLAGAMSGDNNKQITYYKDKKSKITTKASTDNFISSIYFFADEVASLSTNKKSTLDMYTGYTESEQGKIILEDPQSYYWLGETSIIDETLNINSEEYAIRVVKAFYKNDAFLVLDVDKQAILNILQKIQLGKGSHVAFITADKIELQQDGSRNTIFSETEFYQSALESEMILGTYENVTFENNDYMFMFRKISDTGAMVCALIPRTEIVNQVGTIKYVTISVVIVACIIAILIAGLISVNINSAVRYMIKKMKLVAKGDITIRLSMKRKDEFAELAEHMNEMLSSMEILLKNVKAVSRRVADSANDLSASTVVFVDSTSYIFRAINEIENGLFQQAGDTISCVDKLDGLASQIGLVDRETNEIKGIADKTSESIIGSLVRMGVLKDKAEETSQITQEVIGTIEDMHHKTKQIDNIINAITEIADETTLLALNASIEAARAGNAGRGFSVVAEEISKLADQSMHATNEIRVIIDDIKKTTIRAVETANKAGNVIILQEEAVGNTTESFDDMNTLVGELIHKVAVITESVSCMQGEKKESVENMQNISAVTEEVVASVSTINGKTKSQMDAVSSLTRLSEEMLAQVSEMEETMKNFSISDDVTQ